MIWPWIIAAIVIVLFLFEFVAWIKRRRMPAEAFEAAVDEVAVEEQLAELARAQMKIAMLESHMAELQETNAALQEGNEALQQSSEAQTQELQAHYREQLDLMEVAYQRQMVMLSDRLALQGGASAEGIRARKGPKEYEVRLASEVDKWLSRFEDGDQPQRPATGDDASSENEAAAPDDAAEPLSEEAQAGASEAPQNDELGASPAPEEAAMDGSPGDAGSEPSAAVRISDEDDGLALQADIPSDGEEALDTDLELDALYSDEESGDDGVAVRFLAEADLSSSASTAFADQELLAAVRVLENAAEEPALASESDSTAQFGVKDAIKNTSEAPLEADLGYDYEEVDTTAAVSGRAEVENESATDGRMEEASPDLTAVFDRNGWSERRVRAMQRALARRLGSELDADYLDDDEFLRELDIDQHALVAAALTSEKLEDIMSSDDWVSDPIEELANYIRRKGLGSTPALQESDDHRNGINGHSGQNGAAEELNVWEEMVRDGASGVRENGGMKTGAAADANGGHVKALEDVSEPVAAVEEAPQNGAAAGNDVSEAAANFEPQDEEEISATVAAILARAPEVDEAAPPDFTSDYLPGITMRNGGTPRSHGDRFENGTVETPDTSMDPEPGLDDLFAEPETEVGRPLTGTAAVEPQEPFRVNPHMYETEMDDSAQEDESEEEPILDWEREPITWQAEYYNNTRLADGPAVVRQDRDINFRWRDRAPAQGVQPCTFSVRWLGTLMLEPGQYRFTTTAPDGIRLWLNDRLVISAWYDQSEQTYQRDFTWHGGPLDVRVEHYENGGNARAKFTWQRTA